MDDLEATRDRLENWGRWAAGRGGAGQGRCASLEGRYVPERLGEGEEASRRTPRIPIDDIDAEYVDRIVSTYFGFPRRLAMTLVAHFVWRLGTGGPFRRFMRTKGYAVHDRDRPALILEATAAARARLRAKRRSR